MVYATCRRALHLGALALVAFSFLSGAAPLHSLSQEVEFFSPEGELRGARQVVVRFTTPMVAFGDPRAPAPFRVDCPAAGEGRWADPRNWVYDFEADLESGLACVFTPLADLTDLEGAPVAAEARYGFNTGGPRVLGADPRENHQAVEENQVFALVFDGRVDAASFEEVAACLVEDMAEEIPMEVLAGEEAEAVLAHWLADDDNFARLANEDDYWSRAPSSDPEVLAAARERLLLARCRQTLPAARALTIEIGAGLAAPSGIATDAPQRLAYRVRPAFLPSFSCQRLYPEGACLPITEMALYFGAAVPREAALAVELVGEDGTLYPAVDPSDEAAAETLDYVVFKPPFPEKARFSLTLPEGLVDQTGRSPANADKFPLAIGTDEHPPLVKFPGTFGILELAEGGVLPISLRNVEAEVAGRYLRLTSGPAEITQWMARVEEAERRTGEWTTDDEGAYVWIERTGINSTLEGQAGLERFTVPKPEGPKAFEVVGAPLGEPGFYVVELASPKLGQALLAQDTPRYVATSVLVTNMAVHLQWGTQGSVVWVTDLEDGAPVEGTTVEIATACDGALLWEGATDADGLARVPAGALPDATPWGHCAEWSDSYPLMVTARLGEDMSFTLSEWSNGLEPYEFGFDTGSDWDREVLHTVFDRPLYRAGETVSMKHFLRRKAIEGFALPEELLGAGEVEISHFASGDSYVYEVTLDAQGIGETSWRIPQDAKLGEYEVRLRLGDESWRYGGDFRVEEFRLPSLTAGLQGPDEAVIAGAPFTLDLYVAYLSGGGAGGLDVKLRTLVEERRLTYPAYDQFVFGGDEIVEGTEPYDDYGWYEETGGNATPRVTNLTLDDEGAARVTLEDYPALPTPSRLVAELEYQDANGEVLTAARSFDLWPAAVSLGIKTDGWAASTDGLRFQVLALDPAGKPIAGQQVTAELFTQEIFTYRKRLVGGFYSYESLKKVTKLEESCTGVANDQGVLVCELAPSVSGEVLIRASATDGAGDTAFSTDSIWVVGEDDWWFDAADSDRMDLLPELPEYEAGDTARFQVRMPFREATALVTVLREGVIESFVTELSGEAPVIEVPIAESYAPNVYVSVLAVRGRIGSIRSQLAELARDWDLPWISREGGPPTGTVDLSKPAYRLGMAEIKVGWAPHRLDVAVTPETRTYGVREEAQVAIQVTPALGGELPADAEVAIAVVDEALLQLRANRSWDLLTPMMDERGIEVFTSTAQMQVIGKRHYGRKALPDGGGGGRLDARELFDTLLLWEGRVPLDAEGRADVTVPLNDSLTAFRIVAIASAGSGLFGTGSATINTTQDLMLFSGLPPVVRQGDRFAATFTVRNAGDAPLEADLVASVAELPSASFQESLALAAGEARQVVFEVETPLDVESLTWSLEARAGAASDALTAVQEVEEAIPVRVYQASLAQLDEPIAVVAAPPDGALPGRGGMSVTLLSSLAGEQPALLDYMARYPYTCFEQKASKAIALGDAAGWAALMQAAPAYLDRNGLVKYYPSDWLRGSAVLTAYILSVADEAGWEIPANVQSRMIAGLEAFVEGRTEGDSVGDRPDLTLRKLSALAALARYGDVAPGLASAINFDPNLWPTSAVLDWIDVLKRTDLYENQVELLEQAKAIIRARLNFQGTTLGFSTEERDYLWWLMVSVDLNAVRAIGVLADDPAWAEDMPRLLRGALGRQINGRWSTTVANAWGVLALKRYRQLFEAEPVTGESRAVFGAAAQSLRWSGLAGEESHSASFAWREQPTTLSLEHAGGGAPWALIQSRAALPLEAPLSSGYAITRSVTPIEQQTEGQWTAGDVLRVTLEIEAQSDMTWVVVDEPIPAGASLLGSGLGGDSRFFSQDEADSGRAWLAFEERRFDVFRAYYRYVPKGAFTVEYTIRLNNPGVFRLPATRVEAMYAPEMFGEAPNDTLEVLAR